MPTCPLILRLFSTAKKKQEMPQEKNFPTGIKKASAIVEDFNRQGRTNMSPARI